jgi:hypothetical protein
MKLMKFLFLFAVSVLMFSCKGNPDNNVYGEKAEFSHYEAQGAGKEVKSVYDSTVLLKPTWSQAHVMASHRADNWVWKFAQIVLLSLLAISAYLVVSGKREVELGRLFYWAVLGFLFIGFNWQSASIKWENEWYVPKSQYEKEMKENGSTQAIWDSLENGYHIKWGKYKK